jgi:tRNA pseudouridine38-40 synthase
VLGANTELAPEIRLIWAREVPEHFHARFSAEWRRYRYLILNSAVNSALTRNRAAWVRSALSLEPMRRAAAGLTGEHDFSSFRAAECQARSPVRRLTRLSVTAEGGFIAIEAEANAFLHHMVRNLAGFLIAVGSGERTPESAAELLAQRDRRLAPPTAPPQGLYLAAVGYPAAFRLPAASGALAN